MADEAGWWTTSGNIGLPPLARVMGVGRQQHCAWYLDLYQLSDKCVYVYCVESFAHIECYSDYCHRGSHLVEPLFYDVYCV